MAYALWATLGVLILTGLVMTGGKTPMQLDEISASVAKGDWSVLIEEGEDDNESDEGLGQMMKELHEVAGNLILALAFLHVAGVFLESRALRRNLVKPMLLGGR